LGFDETAYSSAALKRHETCVCIIMYQCSSMYQDLRVLGCDQSVIFRCGRIIPKSFYHCRCYLQSRIMIELRYVSIKPACNYHGPFRYRRRGVRQKACQPYASNPHVTIMVHLDIITEGYGRKRFNLTRESSIVDSFNVGSPSFPSNTAEMRVYTGIPAR
jgi:hypothetical protein